MSVWIRLAFWSGRLLLRCCHLDDAVKTPWVCCCQSFYTISGTSSTCGHVHDWFPNCHQGFSLLFFWSVGDLLFVFPSSLQHGPWILALCMTGNCFWVTVRSRIWLVLWRFAEFQPKMRFWTYMQQCIAYLLFQLLDS
jgi:hypothetical protein